MEHEGSLPRSQQPATCPCPKINSVHAFALSLRNILISSSHLRLGLQSGFYPSGVPTKTLYEIIFTIHATWHASLIWWPEYFATSTNHDDPQHATFSFLWYLPRLGSNIFPSTLLSNTCGLWPSIHVTYEVQHA